MKILLISYFFPPYNVIGAIRTGKLAEYWLSQGHDVKVISAKDQPLMSTLTTKLPQHSISYTNWININALPELVLGGRGTIARKGFVSKKSIFSRMGNIYKTILNFPDGQIGWYPFAVRAGRALQNSGWQPDLIYASAHPLTSLLVAHKLAKILQAPWVAEYRDLWADNPYYQYPTWRNWIERKLEKRVLATAAAAVTVSQPLAETLRNNLSIPVATILNGFDPDDYKLSAGKVLFEKDKLNIVYTGMVYAGKRDPTALFLALKQMRHASSVRVHFYGRYLGEVERLADAFGVRQSVTISDMVSYQQSIQIQMQADLLLLLLWNDPREQGVYTGKLFEYVGARHPILAIGSNSGVAATLIKQRGIGFISNDVIELTRNLDGLVEDKLSGKELFITPEEACIGLTRAEQFSSLDSFLQENSLMKNIP